MAFHFADVLIVFYWHGMGVLEFTTGITPPPTLHPAPYKPRGVPRAPLQRPLQLGTPHALQ